MAKPKYEMKTERSDKMDSKSMQQLADMRLAPYMQLATGLIGKERHAGGNMFRHQMDTLAALRIVFALQDLTNLIAQVNWLELTLFHLLDFINPFLIELLVSFNLCSSRRYRREKQGYLLQ